MPTDENVQLDFEYARRKIISEELKGNNPVPDILGFLHLPTLLGADIGTKMHSLMSEYNDATSNIQSLLKIDVPKANFTLRPMARPEIKTWLIYEAIICNISDEILKDDRICTRSFSILNYRIKNARGTDAWLKFDDKCRNLYETGYKYVVITDITGFYENINLSQLRSRVFDYIQENDNVRFLVDVLFNLLRKWSDERIHDYSLPQGPPASAFLADIYLDYVDRIMEKYEGYYRYMDDIRIFCKNEIQTKLALKDLTLALRNLKLNINAKKTAILKGRNIEKRFDPEKQLLNIIELVLKSKSEIEIKAIALPSLVELFKKAFSNDPFEKTHLNFTLPRLGMLHNSGFEFETQEVIRNIIKNFVSKPHHAGLFCNFFTFFPDDDTIPKFLIEFLRSKNNIYEWQELKVLQILLRFQYAPSPSDVAFFFNSANDSNKHFAVRAFYYLLTGKYGNNRDRQLIVDSYWNQSSGYTKTAIILAVQELGLASRNDFYSRVKRCEANSEIPQFTDYVKSLSGPIYYLTTKKPKIETLEELEGPSYENI